MLDPEAFNKCYIDWVHALVNILDEVVAVDGKILRRSHDRSNGKIEKSPHWCLDITSREDDRAWTGESRHPSSPLALSLIEQDAQWKIGVKASRKRAGWDLGYTKSILRLK